MTEYLEHANPILAVKSEVYFGFQMRRMKEIQNVQHFLSEYWPPNYGMATALLMHMLCNIPHSPMSQTTHLRDALKELQYKKVMDTFGTFFLHNLDLEHAILGQVVEEDSDECLLAMSQIGRAHV